MLIYCGIYITSFFYSAKVRYNLDPLRPDITSDPNYTYLFYLSLPYLTGVYVQCIREPCVNVGTCGLLSNCGSILVLRTNIDFLRVFRQPLRNAPSRAHGFGLTLKMVWARQDNTRFILSRQDILHKHKLQEALEPTIYD